MKKYQITGYRLLLKEQHQVSMFYDLVIYTVITDEVQNFYEVSTYSKNFTT